MTSANTGARMASATQDKLVFEDCVLDLATRQLWRRDSLVSLQPRVFDLLVFLINRRERAVNKDEIQDAVWGNTVVSETALTRAVMKARRAIGDDADEQRLIRTVHGHGYQFTGQLITVDASVVEDADGVTDGNASASQTSLLVRSVRIVFVAAVVIIAVLVLWLVKPQAPDSALRIAMMPVLNDTGSSEFDFATLGLMGLSNGLLADEGQMDVVRAVDVMQYVDYVNWREGDDDTLHAQALRDAYGASHVVVARLTQAVGGLRLSYSVTDHNGRRTESTMVAVDTGSLVRGMVRTIADRLGGVRHALANDAPSIDQDPFINEAYTRALATSLEGRCGEAVALFDVVLARASDTPRAQLERANCLSQLGRWQEAEAAYRRMTASASDNANPVVLAKAFTGLGRVLYETGRRGAANTAYQQSLDIAASVNDKEAIGRALISMAILAYGHRDYPTARELLARSTLQFRQLEWAQLPGQIYSAQANIAMNDGKLSDAEQFLEKALISFRAVGDRRSEAMMLNNYGFLRRLQGRFSDAEPLHLESLRIRKDIGDTVGQGRILGMLSILYQRKGRLDEALSAAERAVTIARDANDALFLAGGLAQLAATQLALGDAQSAQDSFDEAGKLYTQIGDQSRAAQVSLRLADIDVQQGREEQAAQRVGAVLAVAQDNKLPAPAIEALQRRGDLFQRRGQLEQARASFEQALDLIDESGVTDQRAPIAIQLANLYLDADDPRAAEPLLGYIIEEESTIAGLRLQARYAARIGDSAGASRALQAAKQLSPERWGADDERALQFHSNQAQE